MTGVQTCALPILLKTLADLKTQAKSRDEETATIVTQLKLERDVHQRELEDLTSSLQSVKTKHEQNIQELMKHFKKEKSEAENHIRTLKVPVLNYPDATEGIFLVAHEVNKA